MVKRAMHVIPTVRMVHICPPIVVHTDPSSFRTTVQELTGFKRKSTDPDCGLLNKGTTNCPIMIKSNDTFYDDHINAFHYESYDHISTLYGDCTSSKSCNTDCINNQIDSIYDDCDGLLMVSAASFSPKCAPSSSSHVSLMPPQQQEDTSSLMVWDSEENCRMFACSTNTHAYAHELSPLKKLKLEYAGTDLQPDNQLMSNNFMETFPMEETLDFLGLDDEQQSGHHLLQDHLSTEVLSLISAL